MRRFGEFIDDEEDDDADPVASSGDTVTDAPPLAPPAPVSMSPDRFQKLQNRPAYVPPPAPVVPASGAATAHAPVKPVPASGAGHHPVAQSPTKAVKAAAHATGHSPAALQNATTYPTKSPAKTFKNGGRPAPSPAKRRNRYAGHADFNNLVRTDWQRAIEDDPYAFDALVYLPELAEYTPLEQKHHEQPDYTEINNNQRELVYGLPEPVVMLDCPDERENFFTVDNDGDQDGYVDEYLVVRVAATGIPIGSVFEWMEETMDGSAKPRWWYVVKIFAYGTAAVGSLYFCVPARNFEGSTPRKGNIHA